MRLIEFLIIITTYNRNIILNDAIKSIFDQKYPHWTLLVSDNASETPVANTIPDKYKNDPRVVLVSQDGFPTGGDHAECLFKSALDYQFDYLVMLADDDILLPYALDYISRCCSERMLIGCSIISYYQNNTMLSYQDCGSKPYIINGIEGIKYHSQLSGVSFKESTCFDHALIGPTHISTYFVHRAVLKKVLDQYGIVTSGPFGDVGYGKFVFLAEEMLYIPVPMGIIRFFDNYGMAGKKKGNRRFLDKHHTLNFRLSPVKAVTFANASLESYLTLLDALKIPYSKRPQLVFFLRHLREILQDGSYDEVTCRDLLETIIHLFPYALLPATLKEICKIIGRKMHRNTDAIIKDHTVQGINSIFDGCRFAVEKYASIVGNE